MTSQSTNTVQKYITSRQLCERFHKTTRTLYRWQKILNFPKPAISYRGGQNMWNLSDVERWEKEYVPTMAQRGED